MSDKTATKKTTKRAPRSRSQASAAKEKESGHGTSVPVLVPEVHVRHLHVPQVGHVPHVHLPVPDAVRRRVPDPAGNRLIWYGGLAGLAAFGIIGWPVAGVVAAGTYVAEHRARAAMQEASPEHDGGEQKATSTAKA
jgi:hypothetical protein